MRRNVIYLTVKSTYGDIQRLLRTTNYVTYPVVADNDSMILPGAVPRKALERLYNNASTLWLQNLQKKVKIDETGYFSEKEEPKEEDSDWGITQTETNVELESVTNTSRENFLDQEVSVNFRELDQFDACPFQVVADTALAKVHWLFAMLGLSHAFIVQSGALVGVLTRKDLIKYSNKK